MTPPRIAFAGPRQVLQLPHTKRAKSYEAFGSLNPQFASARHRGADRAFELAMPLSRARWLR